MNSGVKLTLQYLTIKLISLPYIFLDVNHCTLQVHGEVTNSKVDVFDRENVFIETILEPLVQRLPQLKV